jgi:hypothetical protein
MSGLVSYAALSVAEGAIVPEPTTTETEELIRSAEAHFRATTITYPEFLKRVQFGYKGKPYNPLLTSWGKGFEALAAAIEAIPLPPPPPPPPPPVGLKADPLLPLRGH